jgi:hypothetical protein
VWRTLSLSALRASAVGNMHSSTLRRNIAETICSKTWTTKSIRPPATYTTKLKLKQLRIMGLTGHAALNSPKFAFLRSDPRIKALRNRLGLPE